MSELPAPHTWKAETRPPSIAEYREAVFNEVIYVLEVLNRAVVATTSIDSDGVTLALEMVKAMKAEEA